MIGRWTLVFFMLLGAVGCSASAAKPLPKGPPPEYEPPRAFDAGAADRLPGTPPPNPAPEAAP